MLKEAKKAFTLLKNNTVVIQPLILFMLVAGYLSAPVTLSNFYTQPSLLAIVTLSLLSSAFLAGWFYVIKLTVSTKDKTFETPESIAVESFANLKQFFTGVGDYFLSILGGIIVYILTLFVFSLLAFKLGVHLIGDISISNELKKALTSSTPQEMQQALNAINYAAPEQIKLAYWGGYISILSLIFSFFTTFYGATILYETKNPLTAILLTLRFIFKNFAGSIGIFLLLLFLQFGVYILNAISFVNVFVSILTLILIFFYLSYQVILVFLYYEEKTKNHSNSGPDSVG